MAVDISPLKDNGVLKEIIKEGEGDETPFESCQVTVHYTGTLLDGTKFDSSKDRNQPFKFNLGKGEVIKAWDIGVATMKKGEVAMLTCDAKYAYGASGSPPKIPPNATLKFEVEVLGWSGDDLSADGDGSIERFKLVSGKGNTKPNDGALVEVHLIGKYNDKVFEERDVKFNLGEGTDVGIVEGVERALGSFNEGEKSKLKIKSKYAFGQDGKPELNIPANADVEYIVELKTFEKTKAMWVMEGSEKVEQAKICKDKATNYFKAGKYVLAIKMCKNAVEYLNSGDFDSDIKQEHDQIILSAYLNLALFYLKTNQHFEAKEACNDALKYDSKNEKALFRRGQALLALASPESAIKDFEQVLEIEPKNTAAIQQINACKNIIKQNLNREKKLYANMFEKFAKTDKQKEENIMKQQPDVMKGTLGEWGQEERQRDATAFEKENPNIFMLNANDTGEFKNM